MQTQFLFSSTLLGLDIKGSTYKVYQLIVSMINKYGKNFARQKTLAKMLGVSVATVIRAIKELEELGKLRVVRSQYSTKKKKRHSSNEYFVDIKLSENLVRCNTRLISLLNATELKFFQLIQYRVGLNQTCYITIEDIAKACHISVNNAYRVRASLERKGLLVSTNKYAPEIRNNRNVYALYNTEEYISSCTEVPEDNVECIDYTDYTNYEFEEFVANSISKEKDKCNILAKVKMKLASILTTITTRRGGKHQA